MMKLPWSKTKKKYQYSQHSAPITNGILRNGKGATAAVRQIKCDDVHVTFSVRRTGSAQMLDAVDQAYERTRSTASKSSSHSHGRNSHTPDLNDSSKTRRKTDSRHRKKHDATSSNKSDSMDNSPEESGRRLSEITTSKGAASYGQWDSNGTMSTVDTAESYDMEGRPPLRSELSLRIDEKIEAKSTVRTVVVEKADASGMEEQPSGRSKLSLLLDKKIEAKMRREAMGKTKS
mmetsp:Transcript_6421/g.13994  ORF Transcript_6421/g.13994 Transcript_6421/m.13994 type:complete len:233 (-) Transcript_6421:140-838(-)